MERLTSDELRQVQLDILRTVDQFCRERQIIYYLAFGTLLGAVRHRGYIPWDDDIDLMMPRRDYDTFVRDFPRSPAADGLSLGSTKTRDDWPFPYAKVSDDRTELREESEIAVSLGVNIDIFPVDGCPRGRVPRRLQGAGLSMFRSLLMLKSVAPRPGRATHRRLVSALSKPLLRLIPTCGLVAGFDRLARRYDMEASTDVGVRVGSFDWWVPTGALGVPVDLAFEDGSFPAPSSSEVILRRLYGDYMELPAEAERTSHHRFMARWRDGEMA